MNVTLIHKIYTCALCTSNATFLTSRKQDLVFSMTRSTLSRAIRIPATLLRPTLLRTFASSLSKGLGMTQPAEETRNVEDMDRLLEIIRALTTETSY